MEAPPAPINSAWRQQLAAWLAAHKTYPEEARRRGEEGSVTLRFTVERTGRVTETTVVRGSGSSILDAAAEAMLRNATLPPFPETMLQARIGVTVQVRFALTN
jgi:periplasmic protein TonB